jgi:hypothetical protein
MVGEKVSKILLYTLEGRDLFMVISKDNNTPFQKTPAETHIY